MTEGQEWALAQLRDVAASGQAVEIVEVRPPAAENGALTVELSIDCRDYQIVEAGLPLRLRERVVVSISADFPLDRPSIWTTHNRFAGHPHVQWGSHLCLYQSPDTEWSPSDGMFGFLERLNAWLQAAARGQLDPTGMPLHPPVAYAKTNQYVVPRVNTPPVGLPWWIGYARITSSTKAAVLLGTWHPYNGEVPEGRLAGAVLLPGAMPFEYPETFEALARSLGQRNVSRPILRAVLVLTALRAAADEPLYVLLGAAMRGIAGASDRLQHLACWYIAADRANALREFSQKEFADDADRDRAFGEWAGDTVIDWCPVKEDRPEIVVPRDAQAPMAWWRGKRVTLLGCGALGSASAMMLARAGVAHFNLFDKRAVTPGVLSRQNFQFSDIGFTKVSTTRNQLRWINPDVGIAEHAVDIVRAVRTSPADILDCDVIVNATASEVVGAALERWFANVEQPHPPIVSMAVGHRCDTGIVTLGLRSLTGVTQDLDRRTKIAVANSGNGRRFLDEFWPLPGERRELFQPEPGCSDPTFVGSAADVFSLSGSLLNIASVWLAEPTSTARSALVRSPHAVERGTPAAMQFSFPPDRRLLDPREGYCVRLSAEAERDLMGWIRTSTRQRGTKVETGGLLFGQTDEFLKIIWVTEIGGPPPDSVASEAGFICGTAGTKALSEEKRSRTRDSVHFIGMWHTHPDGSPHPSDTDLNAMQKLKDASGEMPRQFLMLIAGGRMVHPSFAAFVFGRSQNG